MKKEDFFEVLGELSDHIVKGAEAPMKLSAHTASNRGRAKTYIFRRALAVAAIIALMVCSGTVGALAFSREVIVEVPVEQETAELGAIGLTLVFPDSWKGRYALSEAPDGGWVVYSPMVKEALAAESDPLDDPLLELFNGGVLFYIVRYDEPVTEEQFIENGWDFTGYRYLLATGESTYVLYYASDVQFDPNDPMQVEEYSALSMEMRDIQIIVNGILA